MTERRWNVKIIYQLPNNYAQTMVRLSQYKYFEKTWYVKEDIYTNIHLFLYQLIFPICDTSKSVVENYLHLYSIVMFRSGLICMKWRIGWDEFTDTCLRIWMIQIWVFTMDLLWEMVFATVIAQYTDDGQTAQIIMIEYLLRWCTEGGCR